MASTSCPQFDSREETITEFLQRFKVQCEAEITKAGENGKKKAAVLIRALPVNVITDLQRRIKPILLADATYDLIESKLTSQYEVKNSVVGASVKFLKRRQLPGESIESYVKCLNDLASSCNCLLYTSPSPRDKRQSRMPSSA